MYRPTRRKGRGEGTVEDKRCHVVEEGPADRRAVTAGVSAFSAMPSTCKASVARQSSEKLRNQRPQGPLKAKVQVWGNRGTV